MFYHYSQWISLMYFQKLFIVVELFYPFTTLQTSYHHPEYSWHGPDLNHSQFYGYVFVQYTGNRIYLLFVFNSSRDSAISQVLLFIDYCSENSCEYWELLLQCLYKICFDNQSASGIIILACVYFFTLIGGFQQLSDSRILYTQEYFIKICKI